jgi:hypothetical protein
MQTSESKKAANAADTTFGHISTNLPVDCAAPRGKRSDKYAAILAEAQTNNSSGSDLPPTGIAGRCFK